LADEGWYKQKFINWAEESADAVLLFGPLIERGMSLREIKQHTSAEILAMTTILGRMSIIDNGKMLDAKRQDGKPLKGLEAVAYTNYLEEMEKLKKGAPEKIDEEDDLNGFDSD